MIGGDKVLSGLRNRMKQDRLADFFELRGYSSRARIQRLEMQRDRLRQERDMLLEIVVQKEIDGLKSEIDQLHMRISETQVELKDHSRITSRDFLDGCTLHESRVLQGRAAMTENYTTS